MTFTYDNNEIKIVTYNDKKVNKITYNGILVYSKETDEWLYLTCDEDIIATINPDNNDLIDYRLSVKFSDGDETSFSGSTSIKVPKPSLAEYIKDHHISFYTTDDVKHSLEKGKLTWVSPALATFDAKTDGVNSTDGIDFDKYGVSYKGNEYYDICQNQTPSFDGKLDINTKTVKVKVHDIQKDNDGNVTEITFQLIVKINTISWGYNALFDINGSPLDAGFYHSWGLVFKTPDGEHHDAGKISANTEITVPFIINRRVIEKSGRKMTVDGITQYLVNTYFLSDEWNCAYFNDYDEDNIRSQVNDICKRYGVYDYAGGAGEPLYLLATTAWSKTIKNNIDYISETTSFEQPDDWNNPPSNITTKHSGKLTDYPITFYTQDGKKHTWSKGTTSKSIQNVITIDWKNGGTYDKPTSIIDRKTYMVDDSKYNQYSFYVASPSESDLMQMIDVSADVDLEINSIYNDAEGNTVGLDFSPILYISCGDTIPYTFGLSYKWKGKIIETMKCDFDQADATNNKIYLPEQIIINCDGESGHTPTNLSEMYDWACAQIQEIIDNISNAYMFNWNVSENCYDTLQKTAAQNPYLGWANE